MLREVDVIVQAILLEHSALTLLVRVIFRQQEMYSVFSLPYF